jgi:hypothetical protein
VIAALAMLASSLVVLANPRRQQVG